MNIRTSTFLTIALFANATLLTMQKTEQKASAMSQEQQAELISRHGIALQLGDKIEAATESVKALQSNAKKPALSSQEQNALIRSEVFPWIKFYFELKTLVAQAEKEGVLTKGFNPITASVADLVYYDAQDFITLFRNYMSTNDTRLGRMVRTPKTAAE